MFRRLANSNRRSRRLPGNSPAAGRKEGSYDATDCSGHGTPQIIKKIGGNPEVKQHLENLGFVVGGTVTVVNSMAGNLIVNVKESRIAISREMAQKIMI